MQKIYNKNKVRLVMEQGDVYSMIITGFTPKDQVTIPRAVMKKLDISAGSDVSIEVAGGTVVIRKIDSQKEKDDENVASKIVNY